MATGSHGPVRVLMALVRAVISTKPLMGRWGGSSAAHMRLRAVTPIKVQGRSAQIVPYFDSPDFWPLLDCDRIWEKKCGRRYVAASTIRRFPPLYLLLGGAIYGSFETPPADDLSERGHEKH
jgi:hypothetical protein